MKMPDVADSLLHPNFFLGYCVSPLSFRNPNRLLGHPIKRPNYERTDKRAAGLVGLALPVLGACLTFHRVLGRSSTRFINLPHRGIFNCGLHSQ